MDARSVSQERVTDLLVRWSDGDDAALAELVSLVSVPIRARLDKRFLGIDVGYLNLRRVAKRDCIAAQLPELSRRSEGEEFRAAEAGGKNGRRAPASRELQDIAVRNCICLGYKEIARAVKGQAPRCS
jgi:hypothetical protein